MGDDFDMALILKLFVGFGSSCLLAGSSYLLDWFKLLVGWFFPEARDGEHATGLCFLRSTHQ